MKTFLLILWLSAFLPGFVRAEGFACTQGVTGIAEGSSTNDEDSSCSCCKPGSCACAIEPGQETPDLPFPALPPSPDNSGKLFAARLAFFLLSPAVSPPEIKSSPTLFQNCADSRGNLPLHIRYCSRLW